MFIYFKMKRIININKQIIVIIQMNIIFKDLNMIVFIKIYKF